VFGTVVFFRNLKRNHDDFIVNEQTRFMFVNNKKLSVSFK